MQEDPWPTGNEVEAKMRAEQRAQKAGSNNGTPSSTAEVLGPTESGRVKLTVNLPEREMATLRKIAAKRDISLTDAVRRAIAMEQYVDEVQAEGGKLIVEQRDHTMRELVLR